MASILEESGFNPGADLKVVGTNPVKHDGLDKVTGRAKFGADAFLPGMLVGKILRSPHAHAIIKSIDTSKAEALPGVKAVVTRDDFPEKAAGSGPGDMTRNVMAREKALYDGHPVAAIAATSERVAKKALKLIEVEYEILPHVIDPVEAMKPGAPILHDYIRTKGAVENEDAQTNVTERMVTQLGDADAGFEDADIIVERSFDSAPMHQGYIEPQACIADYSEDGQVEVWCCTQAPFVYRDRLSAILDIDCNKINVQQSELGGGYRRQDGFLWRANLAILLSKEGLSARSRSCSRGSRCSAAQGRFPAPATRSRWAAKRTGRSQRLRAEYGLPVRALCRVDVLQRAERDVHAL